MNITYRTEGDYLIPNIFTNEEPEQTLTKYGIMQLKDGNNTVLNVLERNMVFSGHGNE